MTGGSPLKKKNMDNAKGFKHANKIVVKKWRLKQRIIQKKTQKGRSGKSEGNGMEQEEEQRKGKDEGKDDDVWRGEVEIVEYMKKLGERRRVKV